MKIILTGFSSSKKEGRCNRKKDRNLADPLGDTYDNLNNWSKTGLRAMRLDMVERSNMEEGSNERLIRAWLQTKLRITESNKSAVPSRFCFWKRVRLGVYEDGRKDKVGKDGETLMTSRFLYSYPDGVLAGI